MSEGRTHHARLPFPVVASGSFSCRRLLHEYFREDLMFDRLTDSVDAPRLLRRLYSYHARIVSCIVLEIYVLGNFGFTSLRQQVIQVILRPSGVYV